ncbi:MAG: PAS domain S-box protein, partial [Acidobacteriota bacterium]|nr:PAS domain S-box protein [Acidobacteriota bacterium]
MDPLLHILLVEDSAAYADYIRSELASGGGAFAVSHADHLNAAVVLLRAGAIDVVLLDLGLPDSDGLATVHRVVEAAGGVPIVVLSSLDDAGLATAAVQAGAQDYLIKSDIEGRVLARVIRYAVERRAAEARLRERDAHYRSIVESSLDAIVSMDREGRVIEFNPAAEAMFEMPRTQALGRDLAGLIMPERLRERHRAGLARHLSTGETRLLNRRVELTGIRADGSEFPLELTISKLSAAAPIFTGFIRDLSERRRADEAQQQALARIAEQASLLDKAQDAILVR